MHRLSDREMEIFQDIVNSANYKETAKNLFVSENTVKTHVYNIFKKLNLHSISELIRFYYVQQILILKKKNEYLKMRIKNENII